MKPFTTFSDHAILGKAMSDHGRPEAEVQGTTQPDATLTTQTPMPNTRPSTPPAVPADESAVPTTGPAVPAYELVIPTTPLATTNPKELRALSTLTGPRSTHPPSGFCGACPLKLGQSKAMLP